MVLRIIGEMKAKFKVRNPSFSKKITVLLLLVLSFTLSSCNPSTNTGHLSYSKENKTYQYKLDNITENALHIGLFYSEEMTSTSDNTIPNNGHITKLIKYKVYPISDAKFTALSTRICSLTFVSEEPSVPMQKGYEMVVSYKDGYSDVFDGNQFYCYRTDSGATIKDNKLYLDSTAYFAIINEYLLAI